MKRYKFDKAELDIIERSPIPFGVYQFVNNSVKTIALSQGLCDLLGCADKKDAYFLMDNDMYRDAHPDDVARVSEEAVLFATEEKKYDVVYRMTIDGEYHIVHAYGKHVYTDSGVRLAYVWYSDEGKYTARDDDIQLELQRSMGRELSEGKADIRMKYDFLTGLPSMAYFFELVDSYRADAKREGFVPALLFVDLSGMHFFNHNYSFFEGDKLIRAVARMLADHFSSARCSRFGQDHFAVAAKLENIEQTLGEIFEECKMINDGKTLPLRVGIYPDTDENIPSSICFDRAKIACNVTRKAFFSHFRYYDESMMKDSEKGRYIISNIDRAINEGWIKVYYQPIIRSANQLVCEEEALARWIDPEKGMLSPAEFISALEDAKLISRLDLFVVEEVLKKMKTQAEAGLYVVPVSVNLSRVDFENCDMVCEIEKRVDEAGIDRGKLTVEITESVVGSDFEFMKEQIERFRALGFHVWMDDFGSGYSSLDVLQNIGFDVIKLDMRFIQQLDKNEKSKIILTELANMANGLGIDVVAEGVETKEQAEFLTEIGCAKLQGYYFCKALPLEEIVRRNETGVEIGFENPAEADYYSAIGRINLYDFSSIVESSDSLKKRFDTMPMAIFETCDEYTAVIRCNDAYREFAKKLFGKEIVIERKKKYMIDENLSGSTFMQYLKKCAQTGMRLFVNDKLPDGGDIQTIINRISVNHTTGAAACAVVISNLQSPENSTDVITYTNIASALSADYFNLYYVNIEKDTFVEYNPNETHGNLTIERHGENFFEESRKDALECIFDQDRETFFESFTKENVMRSINDHGTFTLTYRLLVDGVPTYVNMKAIRMNKNSKHIIIGINNVDAQMKQQEALERVKEERITYARINALSGDYICIYTVDPETDKYFEYSATRDYEGLGLSKSGADFFNEAAKNSLHHIYIEDLDRFQTMFTKENIIESIKEKGMFILNYRLIMDGEPKYVCLKAAAIPEKDGTQIIVGITNINDQVERDMEYAKNLTAARAKADTDALTGIRNKHAYIDVEKRLDDMITSGEKPEFAIVVCDVNGLKTVNDEFGHAAGDDYLKRAAKIICDIFKHSPVFRVGGDEFAVVASGQDYDHIDELVKNLSEHNAKSKKTGDVVVACGMAKFNKDKDKDVIVVFERADTAMYKNKKKLKK